MLAKKCPTVIECNQYVNLSDEAKNNVVNVDQYQYCGVDEGGEKVEKELGPPPDVSSQFGEFLEDVRFGRKSSRELLGAVVGVVVFILAIILYVTNKTAINAKLSSVMGKLKSGPKKSDVTTNDTTSTGGSFLNNPFYQNRFVF